MINSVTVINDLGERLEMGIWIPDKSGLLISNIDGLSPATADINTTDTATVDGSVYNSSRFPERNININVIYNPEIFTQDAIEHLRHLAYQFFPIKRSIRLIFNTDERISWIEGRVEANDVNIFSRQEEVSFSIICPDPYFRVDGKKTFQLSSTIDMFEFPFSNESLDDPLLIMSELNQANTGRFLYEGDVSTGCIIRLEFSGYVHDLRLYNLSSKEEMRINTEMINALTKPKIVGHLTGIEDEKGEYLFDNYGNILEGFLAEGYTDVNGTLSGIEDKWGDFVTDNYGVTIEGLMADFLSTETSSLAKLEGSNGLYLTDSANGYIEGFNSSNLSHVNDKLTIMVPIDDSKDAPITGMGYNIGAYGTHEYLSDEATDFIVDSQGNKIDCYVLPEGITAPYEESILEAEVTPGIRPGDEIIINTNKGKKSAKLIRNGKEYNILGAISKNSDWIQVIRGYNEMSFWAFYGEDFVNVEYEYEPLYAGV